MPYALHRRFEQLLDARWRPAACDVYPDRAQSPSRKGPSDASGGASDPASGATAGAGGATPSVAKYRPPGSSGSLAAMMRAEREAETSGAPPLKAAAAAASIANTRVIPGMAPPPDTSAANKNKARKERAKKKKEEEAEARAQLEALNESVAGLTTAGGGGDYGPAAPAPAAGAAEAEGAAVDPEKLLKKKLKLVKQIDELKSKAAGGMKLNSDQTAKIATEAALRAEIAELQSS